MTADVRKISKSAQSNISFILNILSETVNVFAYIYLVLEIKNVASFIKTRFYWKQGCLTMWKCSSVIAHTM